MNAKEHPDYVNEQEKLAVVQASIEHEYQALTVKSQDYGRLAKDVISDPEVFSQLIRINKSRLSVLESLKQKPYFGRVDFVELGKELESYYIGKANVEDECSGKPVVLDWRAPLAGLYYSGEIGEVMYNSPQGLIIGDLELKRQYEIVDGSLVNIFDKGLTPMDEFLQKALWEKKDNRLGDIVTTIQDEQNQIIRASKDGVLMIQGVAGSGKTTIVLHRIAYLMYTYQDIFRADKILMVVPNRLFLDYISDVLPDLGVHDIQQVTFEMLYEKAFKKQLKSQTESEKLRKLIALNQWDSLRQNMEFVSSFKGSLKLKRIMDNYVSFLVSAAMPKTDIQVLGHSLYTFEELDALFSEQYAYMPLSRRKAKLITYVKDMAEGRLLNLEAKLTKKYEKQLKSIKENSILSESQRQVKISQLVDEHLRKVDILKQAEKNLHKEYLMSWEDLDIETLLLNLLEDSEILSQFSEGILKEEEVAVICEYTHKFTRGTVEYEDIPALLYLKFSVEGSDLLGWFSHVVVDEAQDYNPLQMHLLTMVSGNNSFTVVGDIAQGINAYRGISGWDELTNQVFSPKETLYRTISICYRSTKEIIEFGNSVIKLLNNDSILLGKPALRTGNKPLSIRCNEEQQMISATVKKIESLRGKGYKSIAIMCKTDAYGVHIYQQLIGSGLDSVQLLTGDELHYDGGVTVMTPQLSKGLEFDAVLILEDESDAYVKDPLHIKLFYVAVTRALHELFIYHTGCGSEILLEIEADLYDKKSLDA